MLGFPLHVSCLNCFNTLCPVLQNEVAQQLKQAVRALQLRVAKTPKFVRSLKLLKSGFALICNKN